MAGYIGQVKIGSNTYPVGSMLYGTCTTAVATADKVVTLAAFDTLATGVTVHVSFSNANTASAPTLKVGSTAAKAITNPNGNLNWLAGAVIAFTYNGTNWVMNSAKGGTDVTPMVILTHGTDSNAPKINISVNGVAGPKEEELTMASTSAYGVTILSDATNSSASGVAATSKAVKAAYDLANGKQDPITFNTAYNATSNKAATMADIENATSGLTGAMHFIGISSSEITDGGTEDPTIEGSAVTTKYAGDVVLYSGKEFVWTGSAWELLGDEGSYALKTNTASVIKTATLTKNTLPTLTVTSTDIPNVTSAGTAASLTTTTYTVPNVTAAGSAASFSVASGTLTLNTGSAPTLGTAFSIKGVDVFTANTPATLGTKITVGSASGWNAGSQASLSTSTQTVVIP